MSSKLIPEFKKSDDTIVLSVSKVKTFQTCKAKYRYCYIEKLPRKDWEFLTFGKFLHETLENFYKEIINGSTILKNELMTNCFKAAYKNWKAKLKPEQVKEAKEILTQLLKKDEDITVLSVEKEFYIDIDSKILLNGYIDRIQLDPDGMLHVSDYKTTKNKKYLEKDHFQLLTYAFVMCLEDPTLEKVRTSYILLRHGFTSIVKEYSRAEIMKVENEFLEYAKQISDEKLYRPNPGFLCSYCDYYEGICPEGKKMESSEKYGVVGWSSENPENTKFGKFKR